MKEDLLIVTPALLEALTCASISNYAVIVVDSRSETATNLPEISLTQGRCHPKRVVQPRCQKCNRLNPQGVSRCNWCGGRVK